MRKLNRNQWLTLLLLIGVGWFICVRPTLPQAKIDREFTPLNERVQVLIQPQAGKVPLITEIDGAQHEVLVVVYLMTDQDIIAALQRAQARGVKVMVMLEQHPFNAGSLNQVTATKLQQASVTVSWSNSLFALTHQKTVIIDDQVAFILNQNLTASAFAKNREYDIVDTNQTDIDQARALFLADWNRQNYTQAIVHLVVSPNNARPVMSKILHQAESEIDIEMEVIDDESLEALLAEKAAVIPVKVIVASTKKIIANAQSAKWLQQHGVAVRFLENPYLHAKLVIIDDQEAYVGSINFTTQSLDANREMGILLAEPTAVAQLKGSFNDDWLTAQ